MIYDSPTTEREESLDVSELGSIEVDEAPPPLELSAEEMAALANALVEDHAAFADLAYRQEPAHWGLQSLPGLRLPIERPSIEPMALALDGGAVQALHQCMGQGQWQDDALRHQPWRLGDATWGAADGGHSVEGADGPKQGAHAVGVARQWWGHVGTVANGQAGVLAAYASRTGSTLLDRRLSRPEAGCEAAPRERWRQCGLPEAPRCTTRLALALALLQAVVAAGTRRLRWVPCDEAFGRHPAFLDGVAAQQRW